MLTGSGTDMKTTSSGAQQSGVALEILDASSTNLTRISDDFLHVVESLTRLTVTGANLKTMPNLSIVQKTLKTVSFSKNDIHTSPASALQGMTKLESLDLSNNQLQLFPFHVLKSMSALKTIDLAGNRLTTIPIFYGYDSGISFTLKLYSNPLICDRDLCWVKEKEGKVDVKLSDEPCASPGELTNKKWTSISSSDLKCDTGKP